VLRRPSRALPVCTTSAHRSRCRSVSSPRTLTAHGPMFIRHLRVRSSNLSVMCISVEAHPARSHLLIVSLRSRSVHRRHSRSVSNLRATWHLPRHNSARVLLLRGRHRSSARVRLHRGRPHLAMWLLQGRPHPLLQEVCHPLRARHVAVASRPRAVEAVGRPVVVGEADDTAAPWSMAA